jgi:hypothetical protein
VKGGREEVRSRRNDREGGVKRTEAVVVGEGEGAKLSSEKEEESCFWGLKKVYAFFWWLQC